MDAIAKASTPQDAIAAACGPQTTAATTLREIHRQWRQACLRCHPDKHPAGPEREIWSQITVRINQAWVLIQDHRDEEEPAASATSGDTSAAHAAAASHAARKSGGAQKRWGSGASDWQNSGLGVIPPGHVRWVHEDRRVYPGSPTMEAYFQSLFTDDYAPWIHGREIHANEVTDQDEVTDPIDTRRLFSFLLELRNRFRIHMVEPGSQELTLELPISYIGVFIADLAAGENSPNYYADAFDRNNQKRGRWTFDGNWNAGGGLLKALKIIRGDLPRVHPSCEHQFRLYTRLRIRNWLFRRSDSHDERSAVKTFLEKNKQAYMAEEAKKTKKKKRKRLGDKKKHKKHKKHKRIGNASASADASASASASASVIIDLTGGD